MAILFPFAFIRYFINIILYSHYVCEAIGYSVAITGCSRAHALISLFFSPLLFFCRLKYHFYVYFSIYIVCAVDVCPSIEMGKNLVINYLSIYGQFNCGPNVNRLLEVGRVTGLGLDHHHQYHLPYYSRWHPREFLSFFSAKAQFNLFLRLNSNNMKAFPRIMLQMFLAAVGTMATSRIVSRLRTIVSTERRIIKMAATSTRVMGPTNTQFPGGPLHSKIFVMPSAYAYVSIIILPHCSRTLRRIWYILLYILIFSAGMSD